MGTTKYAYEIDRRAAELGNGWRLRLLEDGEEVGGGVFPPAAEESAQEGMDWWNGIGEPERAHWLEVAASAGTADAWLAYRLAEAYDDAQGVAQDWLASRG